MDWISVPEAARLADVTERWMRQLVQDGKVAGMKVGRNYIVSRASAAAYVRSETEGRPRATGRQAEELSGPPRSSGGRKSRADCPGKIDSSR
jgi:excisionase family DNA binding protein